MGFLAHRYRLIRKTVSFLIAVTLVINLQASPWVSLALAEAPEDHEGSLIIADEGALEVPDTSSVEESGEVSGQAEQSGDFFEGEDVPDELVSSEDTLVEQSSTVAENSSDTSADSGDSIQLSVDSESEESSEPSVAAETETDLEIEQENEAVVSAQAEGSAVSGLNDSSSGEGDVDVGTGDVSVEGELLETINTNVNSQNGCLEYYSLEDYEGDLVVPLCNAEEASQSSSSAQAVEEMEEAGEAEEALSPQEESSGLESDGPGESEEPMEPLPTPLDQESTLVENDNQAEVRTEVVLKAISGGNQANSNKGDVSIETGDTSVWLSFLQFINTTVTAEEAVLVLINIFNELVGDIVLPPGFSAEVFGDGDSLGNDGEDLLVSQGLDVLEITNQNRLELQENISLLADSGSNQAGGSSCLDCHSVDIDTGNSEIKALAISVGNTNLVADKWGGVVVNNFGKWEGELVASSEGASLEDTEVQQFSGGNYSAKSSNYASSSHDINLSAVSGLNRASDNNGNVSIRTGNARVSFSFVSFINTTINARRSLFSVINIFGKMVGDIILGQPESETSNASAVPETTSSETVRVDNSNQAQVTRTLVAAANTGGNVVGDPDLIVEVSSDVESGFLMPGERFGYFLSVKNIGLTEAYDVVVESTFAEEFVYESDTSGVSPSVGGPVYSWVLGTLWPGETKEFWVYGKVEEDLAEGQFDLDSQIRVSTSSCESNEGNNIGGAPLTVLAQSVLVISKWHNRGNGVRPGQEVVYQVEVTNEGTGYTVDRGVLDTLPAGFAYVVGSTLRDGSPWSDPAGNNPFYFSLDSLLPGESVLFSYTVYVGDDVESGVYNNSATIIGGPDSPTAESDVKVSVGVEVLGGAVLTSVDQGQVLGLPATGSHAYLIALIGLLSLGVGLNIQVLLKRFSK